MKRREARAGAPGCPALSASLNHRRTAPVMVLITLTALAGAIAMPIVARTTTAAPAAVTMPIVARTTTAAPAAVSTHTPVLQSRAWMMMGTVLEVTLYTDSTVAASAFQAAYTAAAHIDSLMSLHRPESEICRVNREACASPVKLSPETSEVLEAAIRFQALTGGAFDVTIKPAMDLWGFYRKAGSVPGVAQRDSVARLIGSNSIAFDREHRTVRLLVEGAAIDFGGIAKGYAVDRMVDTLRSRGIENGIVNLGGNLRSIGAAPGHPGGWPVGVRDPVEPDSVLAMLDLKDRSVASSGDYEKYTVLDGRKYGHIIDPRTVTPTEGMAGTTVVCKDGMTADILSTALFVMGAERGLRLAASIPGVEALAVSVNASGVAIYRGTGIFAEFEPPKNFLNEKATR